METQLLGAQPTAGSPQLVLIHAQLVAYACILLTNTQDMDAPANTGKPNAQQPYRALGDGTRINVRDCSIQTQHRTGAHLQSKLGTPGAGMPNTAHQSQPQCTVPCAKCASMDIPT